LRSEWIKLRTVRSTIVGFAGAALSLVVFGAIFSSFADGGAEGGPPGTTGDSLASSLGGIQLAQLIIGVLGVLFVTSEYSSGMIRATLAAVSSRTQILRAKTFVLFATALGVMAVASIVAFLVGNAIYAGTGATYSLTDPGVLRAVLGAAVYAAGVGVFGVALGFLLRSAAGAIGVLVTLLLVAPVLIGLVPGTIGEWISKLLPGNAGQAIMDITTEAGQLSPWVGLVVFAGWVIAFLVAAAVTLRRRDA
jgi:ABC-type transport system involved in multi-copper enzyme maturation permease subunit